MKWLAALCLMLVALLLGYRSMQDSALNQQLYERQRELGYPSKKKPFWIGKRIAACLLFAAAGLTVFPFASTIDDTQPMMVMRQDLQPEEKTRAILIDEGAELSSITLNFNIHLISEKVTITDQPLLGFYEADGIAYNVYILDNELVFQDQEGNTYRNQME